MTEIVNLRTEYRENPLGIDITTPRFSWQLKADRRGVKQSAYQVLAASSADLISEANADLWNSSKQNSDQSIHIAYEGSSLNSRQRVYWQVSVWDEEGNQNTSEIACFEMGLLESSDWQANWISAVLSGGARSSIPVPFFRKNFNIAKPVAKARLYSTALGVYECSLNGETVGQDVFAPGWTDYAKQVKYQVYDVAKQLKQGENTLGSILGDGWAAGFVGMGDRQTYVDKAQFLAQLELSYEDGSHEIIATDASWKHQFGPILESDMLMGEAHDARLELGAWDTPTYDDADWLAVETHSRPSIRLAASNAAMIQRILELKAGAPIETRTDFLSKRDTIDFGQNMVGRVRFKGSAPRGTTIVLRFAEVLDEKGHIYTDNLRTASATDVYTFKGEGEEVWETKFTFHGFRYVEIKNYPNEVTADTLTGIVLHSVMTETGEFECSDPLLNQLQSNIVWGQRGNFLDVPTDCPQRDERLGWTGDIQVFVRTASFNMDVAGFMSKWADDVRDAQSEEGAVPAVVPNEGISLNDGGPAWADAAIICPWTIYLCYGDKTILAENYDVMERFMEFTLQESPGYIRCAPDYEGWMGFGDWLSINADTPRDLIGIAFLAYDANLMTKIALILGKDEDAKRYEKLHKDVKTVFQNRFLKGGSLSATELKAIKDRQDVRLADGISQGNLEKKDYGEINSDVYNTELFTPTQTAYVLGLHFDLLPNTLKARAAQELVEDIKRRDMHLSTGFVGSPYLPHALSDAGQLEFSYDLLNQKTWPSWLYAVTQGATTIWERWDGWTEDRGFQSDEMNSFNHYAYGSIGSWMYQVIAGLELDPEKPAYKHSFIQPHIGGGLTFAKASIDTLYGRLSSHWQTSPEGLSLTVQVPANTTATVTIAGSSVSENGVPVKDLKEVENFSHVQNSIRFDIPAGVYSFLVK